MPYKIYGRSKVRRNPRTMHWEVQFSLGNKADGTRNRPTVTGRTKAEAIARADAFQEKLQFPDAMGIPRQNGHPFHVIPAGDSTAFRPPIPRDSGHPPQEG